MLYTINLIGATEGDTLEIQMPETLIVTIGDDGSPAYEGQKERIAVFLEQPWEENTTYPTAVAQMNEFCQAHKNFTFQVLVGGEEIAYEIQIISALYQITKFPVSEHMSENLRLYRAV